MKPMHLCRYHAQRIQNDETVAFRSWNEVTRRGKIAYTQCRLDAAKVYLLAAIEIYLLRVSVGKNALFSVAALSHPLSILIELFILENHFEEGVKLLSSIASASRKNAVHDQHQLFDVLGQHYEKLEIGEKTYFSATKSKNTFRQSDVISEASVSTYHSHTL
ncbi:MAG: hypothetical protein K6L76_08650 [Agarilytica sp.]